MQTTPREAESLAEVVFGVVGSATRLPAELGANYLIDGNGARYVLKLPPTGVDPLALDLENSALLQVASAQTGVAVPRPIPARDGSLLPSRPDGVGFVRLLDWVEGTTYLDADRPPGLAEAIGTAAGQISRALAALNHPAAERSLPFDLMDAPTTIDLHGAAVSSPERRAIVQQIGQHFADRVRPLTLDLPWQVVHNDMNDLNVLVDHSRIAGVIDFGDVLAGPRVIDAAVAATYAMLNQEDPLRIGRDVVEGFSTATELGDAELAVVYDLIRTRLAVSVVLSAARSDATNPHLSVSEGDAWDLLERLEGVDPAVGSAFVAGTIAAQPSDLGERRARSVGPALSVAYDTPLVLMRGSGTYLYDDRARRFVDCVNNIAHVGHCHPRVVAAAGHQMAMLNTNTRYLHPNIVNYAERLARLLPPGLDTCYFVNSGSEANELAIRLARAHTDRYSVAVLEHAYHGNSTTLVDVSPHKFDGPGGRGKPPWVTVLPLPDPYRSSFVGPDAAAAYARVVGPVLERASPAAFIAESLPGVAGQIVPTPGTLTAAYAAARSAGAVVIADEVQVGFGRVGSAFWGFQLAGATPDIVTLGKPMGNGHPLGAVITTRAIAESFDNGMEYFNSFGGNPVSCAVGMAVLDVIEDEELPAHATEIGGYLIDGLDELRTGDGRVGDVRGAGLFIGIEIVAGDGSMDPDAELASRLVEQAKLRGVLLSTDGPHHNVIKVKPPLVFAGKDADQLIAALRAGLSF